MYRAKRVDNGEWVYGMLIHKWACGTEWHKYLAIQLAEDGNSNLVIPESIGQSTGKDNLWGGDIVEADYECLIDTHIIRGVIEYCESDAAWEIECEGFSIQLCADVLSSIKVIGNATDDPKLLEAENASYL